MVDRSFTRKIIGLAMRGHKELGPGLDINFNVKQLRQGIKRVIH